MVNLKPNIMDWYNPPEYKDYECSECGEEIDSPGVCSGACHEASMI
jgi:hypothetical protein|tara:strand:+ start:618 stop:755 length:138 start_codon:yes stop_codon:yes gene_type:complete